MRCSCRVVLGQRPQSESLFIDSYSLAYILRYEFTYDNYTSLWNVLDYCATTVPVTHVLLNEDDKAGYQGRNNMERKIWDDCKSIVVGPEDKADNV